VRDLICYASRTGTKRNLAALRAAGWRLLVSRAGAWRPEGFPYGLDNGAWSDFRTGQPFDGPRFQLLMDRLGAGADWIVVPDIVAGGLPSLALSMEWLPRVQRTGAPALIAVQDGMEPHDLAPIVGPRVGIFLGGSTEWKLQRMEQWGAFCRERNVHYHVARVNTAKRINQARVCGASSIDGSSASRYAETLPLLDVSARQLDMLLPA
jgi:hypothetical protein